LPAIEAGDPKELIGRMLALILKAKSEHNHVSPRYLKNNALAGIVPPSGSDKDLSP
jgi:hypothetical protein